MRTVSEDELSGMVVIQYEALETALTVPGEPFTLAGNPTPE